MQSPQDFDEATAFEQFALGLLPVVPTMSTGVSTIDLRGASPQVAVVTGDDLGGARAAAVIDRLRPLLFGAAWKVLDLLTEFGHSVAGTPPDRGNEYSIKMKVREAKAGKPVVARFTRGALWKTALATYAGLEEVRNSLVHRKAHVDQGGALVGEDRKGKALSPVLPSEQVAFCRLAQRIVNAVTSGSVDSREEGDIRYLLDVLAPHHGRPSLGGTTLGLIPRIIVGVEPDTDGSFSIDLSAVEQRGRSIIQGVRCYDLEIHLDPPTGSILIGALEDGIAIGSPQRIDPAALPAWLRSI